MRFLPLLLASAGIVSAQCPYNLPRSATEHPHDLSRRDTGSDAKLATEQFLQQFYLNDNDSFITTDVGGPISDQNSLSVGDRGPTLLEDFIFRQKIQRFDHERVRPGLHLLQAVALIWSYWIVNDTLQVPERAVHARGAGQQHSRPSLSLIFSYSQLFPQYALKKL